MTEKEYNELRDKIAISVLPECYNNEVFYQQYYSSRNLANIKLPVDWKEHIASEAYEIAEAMLQVRKEKIEIEENKKMERMRMGD